MDGVRITRFTRIAFGVDFVFSLTVGCVLTFLPTETDRFFAWTIKAPVTATFLGAGYLGAVTTLVTNRRATDWRRVRSLAIMGFTLTAMTLLVTLQHLDQFHLGKGSALGRAAGWTWLVVYIAVPILLAVIFVKQERAGERDVDRGAQPLLALPHTALLIQALALTIVGFGLIFRPATFGVIWLWPLPALSAGAVGAWLLTIAAASWWALRARDWTQFRAGIPGLIVFLAVAVVGTARYSQPLDASAWQDRVFLAALAIAVVVLAVGGRRQASRLAG